MKATGIVRKVDHLGRIVLPVELRRTQGIEVNDPIEIYVDGAQIILKKYGPACIFCGETTEREFRGKLVCMRCANGWIMDCFAESASGETAARDGSCTNCWDEKEERK